MEFLKVIEAYQPFDEYEAREKETFLSFIKTFGEKIYTRDNLIGHLTPSCWIVNKDRTKILMAHHKQMGKWAWLGGHADEDRDCFQVAYREAQEESGLKSIKPVKTELFDISVVPVSQHIKRGKIVPAHLHYDPTFLFEADENEELVSKPDENSALQWVRMEEMPKLVPLDYDLVLYGRMNNKVKAMKQMVEKGQIYKHYKGNIYRIICVAKHTEEWEDYVVYQDVSDEAKIWARPCKMFCESLENGVQRFELVE